MWFESLIECTLMMFTCKVVVVLIVVYLFKIFPTMASIVMWHKTRICRLWMLSKSFNVYFYLLPLLCAYFLTMIVLKMIETVGDKSTYVYTKRKSYYFLYSILLSICCFVKQREISFIKYLKCFSFSRLHTNQFLLGFLVKPIWFYCNVYCDYYIETFDGAQQAVYNKCQLHICRKWLKSHNKMQHVKHK